MGKKMRRKGLKTIMSKEKKGAEDHHKQRAEVEINIDKCWALACWK